MRSTILAFAALTVIACHDRPQSGSAADSSRPPNPARGSTKPDSMSAAALEFARDFYKWYVMQAEKPGRTASIALSERPQAVTTELSAALRADFAAQDSVAGNIAGIDWDPLIGGQDTCPSYDVRDALAADSSSPSRPVVRVSVICLGLVQPDTAFGDLVRLNGRWQIGNMRYSPGGADLMTTLRLLAADRKK